MAREKTSVKKGCQVNMSVDFFMGGGGGGSADWSGGGCIATVSVSLDTSC